MIVLEGQIGWQVVRRPCYFKQRTSPTGLRFCGASASSQLSFSFTNRSSSGFNFANSAIISCAFIQQKITLLRFRNEERDKRLFLECPNVALKLSEGGLPRRVLEWSIQRFVSIGVHS